MGLQWTSGVSHAFFDEVSTQAPFGHARLLFSKSHDGKGANGSKNRPHDAYPVRCRVPGYYEPCSERARVWQLEKCRQLTNWWRYLGAGHVEAVVDVQVVALLGFAFVDVHTPGRVRRAEGRRRGSDVRDNRS